MRKILIVIFFLFFILNNGNAQAKSSCFSEQQLLQLQNFSIKDINVFLTGQGWSKDENQINQTSQYFNYYLDYFVEKWEQKTSNFYEGTIYVHYKDGLPNLIIYQSTNSCFIGLKNNLSTTKTSGFNTSSINRHGITENSGAN